MINLYCDHCGCEAISKADDVFQEDEGEACVTCGWPGHVSMSSIDLFPDLEREGEMFEAYWSSDDQGVCNDPDCSACGFEEAV